MKTNRLNPGVIIIILGVVTFFTVLFLAKSPVFLLAPFAPSFTVGESIISFVLLLVFCSISARIMLWAYSKIQLPQHPKRMFIYGFMISVVGILIGMVPGIMQGQYLRKLLKDQLPNLSSSLGYINFLSLGFKPVLFTCAITTIVLLWIARWKKMKEESVALLDYPYRRQDILLIISTLVIYALFLKDMIEFIIFSLSIWHLGPV
jgi:hypothetical protein